MNRSSGPGKTASNLSESVHQRLNIYALAAGAAGVGVLALVQASEAKVVYTPANIGISPRFNSHYHLDLNKDGITDFVFSASSGLCGKACFFRELRLAGAQRDGVEANQSGSAAALSYGARIGELRGFRRTALMFRTSKTTFGGYHQFGNWHNVGDRYLGLKFLIHGKYHFGWARLRTTLIFGDFALLTGYAYETIAGKSIIAGKTHGKAHQDSLSPDDSGPGVSLTNPILDPPQPASLGMLALGAQGVPMWRRKESALEGDLKGAGL
jgi:hypothetical protein